MRTLITSLRICILTALVPFITPSGLFSQTPRKMSYQAVIRNNDDVLVTNKQIGMQISIVQDSIDGAVVYTEIQTPVTNMNGMINIEIGGEENFSDIDWLAGPNFIKTEIAIEAPLTNYTITGMSQILSVPYAIAVNTANTFDKLTSRGALVCNESTEGAMRYNPDARSVEYCNGSHWITLRVELNNILPVINTMPVSSITINSAKSGGGISDDGGSEIIQKGLCWGLETLPTISDNKTLMGTGSASFVSNITGLINNTLYFTRAYSTNNLGTGYGEERAFTTLPQLTTIQASENTPRSFVTGGDIQAGGGQTIIARGVAYGTGTNPNISGSIMEAGTGTGAFSAFISGLTSNTLFYLRAYASNAGGTNYGNQLSIATLAEVVSTDQSSATNNSIAVGGEVLPGGGVNITARGIAYGTSENPDISGLKTNNGNGPGVFISTANALVSNSIYYYRAYATNVGGTSYGANKTATTLASLTTRKATEKTLTSFVTGGDIQTGGGQTVSERGIVYGPSANPTILDNKVIASEPGAGEFSVTLDDLSNKTNNYYFKAYAVNYGGVSYGNEYSSGYFDVAGEGFTDNRDGTSYGTVWIGGKEWMAENLKYLPEVVGPLSGSQTNPYYYVYGYSGTNVTVAKTTSNYQTYGVLYNWPAAINACPAGWHVPTSKEWTQIYNHLGGTSLAGGKLKATTHWNSPNAGATNETGFSALPGGTISDFTFLEIGGLGVWWGAPESSADVQWSRGMSHNSSSVFQYSPGKAHGASVRCVRD
jgi:uncharacterized protein (TIGR02145 family)